MPVTTPLPYDKASEAVQRTYDRIKETIGKGEVSAGYQMMGQVEPFLADSYMNYRKFVVDGAGKLDAKQRAAIVLATSSAMNCVHCVRHHAKALVADGKLSEQQVQEVLAVTATCAMYNSYYKFKDLSGDERFRDLTPGLRAHAFIKTSLEQSLVELINIVVSNINGCLMCTSGHVKKLLELGITAEQIDEAIKVSATMAAFNTFHRTQ
ncbi:MAG: carboxymuconolactone decarboxylase family protein [Phycisphaeraceae bacterium]|nr:carboxymuconolactone decarboxylase family protein [Phycisphaeraceae bacterium]